MPQIISKIKDDLQAVSTLACFVGQSLYIYIYIQQCKDGGGGIDCITIDLILLY